MNTQVKKKRHSRIFLRVFQIFKDYKLLCNLVSLPIFWVASSFCPAWLSAVIFIWTTVLFGCCFLWIFFGLPDVYRHFKTGDLYEELLPSEVILLEEDGTQMVVYRPLFKKGYRNIWARRYNIFHELLLQNGKKICRFKRIL